MDFKVVPGSREMVPTVVKTCFATDPDLLLLWHIAAPASLEACVRKTVHDVSDFHETFQFFLVFVGNTLAGYWGTEKGSYINLIFVKPAFRKRAFMEKFWSSICSEMPATFCTAIYAKNRPAFDFYSKLGRVFKEFEANGHPAVSFVFKKDGPSLCH